MIYDTAATLKFRITNIIPLYNTHETAAMKYSINKAAKYDLKIIKSIYHLDANKIICH